MRQAKVPVAILAADLHLDENYPKRYEILDWLIAKSEGWSCVPIVIVGDWTHKKDYHPGVLLDHVAKWASDAARRLIPVYYVVGNHDTIHGQTPGLMFLEEVGVKVLHEPGYIFLGERSVGVLPWLPDDAYIEVASEFVKDMGTPWLLTHCCIDGALADNGEVLRGIPPGIFADLVTIAGDIHKPQVITKDRAYIQYVGSPYPTAHGQDFPGRVLVMTKDGALCPVYPDIYRMRDVHANGTGLTYKGPPIDTKDYVRIVCDEEYNWKGLKAKFLEHGVLGVKVKLLRQERERAAARKKTSIAGMRHRQALQKYLKKTDQFSDEFFQLGITLLESVKSQEV